MKNDKFAIVLRWGLSHFKIYRNKKTDKIVKDMAHKRGRETDHWS